MDCSSKALLRGFRRAHPAGLAGVQGSGGEGPLGGSFGLASELPPSVCGTSTPTSTTPSSPEAASTHPSPTTSTGRSAGQASAPAQPQQPSTASSPSSTTTVSTITKASTRAGRSGCSSKRHPELHLRARPVPPPIRLQLRVGGAHSQSIL